MLRLMKTRTHAPIPNEQLMIARWYEWGFTLHSVLFCFACMFWNVLLLSVHYLLLLHDDVFFSICFSSFFNPAQ